MPKVSIIIPVHNAEKYIHECLDSVINQTLSDIEIICVDDASTDESFHILEEYNKKDERINILHFNENMAASKARKDAVLAAKGEYILFVDADDTIMLDACEDLYLMINKYQVDILHFSSEIVNCGVDERRCQNMEPYVKPYEKTLTREEVFFECFEEGKYKSTLWNKIYKTTLLKKAFKTIGDGYFPKANDVYAFFIIAYFAQSYQGINGKKYYRYNFGRGETGKNRIGRYDVERCCKSSWVANELKLFLQQRNAPDRYFSAYNKIRESLLKESIWTWRNSIEKIDVLFEYWNNLELINALALTFGENQIELAKKFRNTEVLKSKKTQIKTIGIFYHRIRAGGVQRVISLLIPIYIKNGYRVILFTDEKPTKEDYEVPTSVERVVLPTSLGLKVEDYGKRAHVFESKLREYNVDIMLYHSASSNILLYDIILVKLLGMPFILTMHEMFSYSMALANNMINKRPYIYSLADLVIVLSHTEQIFWEIMGVDALYMPNPIDHVKKFVKDGTDIAKRDKTVLWLGRLDIDVKQCMDALKIMAQILEMKPDTKMLIVGNEVQPGTENKMREEALRLGIEKNIEFCGFHKDVEIYYSRATVLLLTSWGESFSMTLAESKFMGVPVVLYDLPYLELLQDKKGYISVEQRDTKAAANAVCQILENNRLQQKLSEEAKASIKPFLQYDLGKAWQKIFSEINDYKKREKNEENNVYEKNVVKTMLLHYEIGLQKTHQKVESLIRERNFYQSECERLKNEQEIMPRIITCLPHKIRGGIQCYKDNGIIYTARRLCQKIKNKL